MAHSIYLMAELCVDHAAGLINKVIDSVKRINRTFVTGPASSINSKTVDRSDRVRSSARRAERIHRKTGRGIKWINDLKKRN